MTQPLPMMTEKELDRAAQPDEEAGFGALSTEQGHLPLQAMDVTGRVTGLVSEVALRQTFVNTHAEPMEATYIFPLPSRAAVTSFRMEVGGRVIQGEIKERGQARQDYRQAMEQGHRAAITEQERPGVFTMRVGNLMPGEEATVRLTVTGPLPFDQGEATFRFPLVVAPRYIPGAPLPGGSVGQGTAPDTDAVPDASRISPPVLLPGFPSPVRLSLSLTVDPAGMELGQLRSSLHVVQQQQEGQVRVLTLQPGERLNRDFILRFEVGQQAVRTGLALRPDEPGSLEGTFLMTLVPPTDLARAQRPRDVIFVLDRSGSMGGWKMVAARRATARMVDTLGGQDRFAVYAFDHTVETPPELSGMDLAPASDRNRFRAVEFLAKLEARGGTEMAEPLVQATQRLAGGYQERDRVLVLITDGQVGHEDQILRGISRDLRNVRVFTLGVDRAVNEGFLRRLAAVGGGACELVESEDRLDEVMDRVHRRIATPVLTEVQVQGQGLELMPDSLVPARVPDLFASAPLMIMGRYRGEPRGALKVAAADAAGQRWSRTVEGTASKTGAVAAIWARGRLRELEDRYITDRGDKATLERQMVETSLRFSVLCRFTAYVAVDHSEVVNRGGKQQRVIQPVESPDGWDMAEQSASLADCTMSGVVGAAGMLGLASMSGPPAPSPAACAPPPCASPAPAKLAKLESRRSLRSRAAAFFSAPEEPMEMCEEEAAEEPTLDLGAYRRRAGELSNQHQRELQGPQTMALAAMGQLAGRLNQLLEDLRSTGEPARRFKVLADLLRRLLDFLQRGSSDQTALEQLSIDARRVLDDFAGQDGDAPESGEPVGGRGGAFWK